MDSLSPASHVTISGPTYILFGKGRHAYTDHSGIRWEPQPACEGGESLPSTGLTFSGTEDSYIYDGGIRGIVRCIFHARPGLYELQLHFAEPGNLEPAHRIVSLAVNAGATQSVDVVDRAGADRAATTFTIPGIRPENDGTIHLDFTSEVSPVNAIEILPAPTVQPLPLRIVASSTPYKDDTGNFWLSDRYFRGGRHGQPPDQEHRPSLGLYASDRVGTFQYSLPAPTGSKYRVTLYFREPWFGQENGAPGGVGSRIFNVYCNGQSVLQNFDILAEGHGQSVTKTFDDVSPTAQGDIAMKRNMLAGLLALGIVMAGPLVAQNTADTAATKKQLKTDQKEDKDQAKADKAERKALGTKQQKKADKAQDKANKQAEKTIQPQN